MGPRLPHHVPDRPAPRPSPPHAKAPPLLPTPHEPASAVEAAGHPCPRCRRRTWRWRRRLWAGRPRLPPLLAPHGPTPVVVATGHPLPRRRRRTPSWRRRLQTGRARMASFSRHW
eukprot:4841438-Pyramimonas_sp.AAC.1